MQVLNAECDALITTIKSEMDTLRAAKEAYRVEVEGMESGREKWQTTLVNTDDGEAHVLEATEFGDKMNSRLVQLNIRENSVMAILDAVQGKMDALRALRSKLNAEREAYKAAKYTAEVEARHNRWKVVYLSLIHI